jgi:predicted MFS family arabinose efflux permease
VTALTAVAVLAALWQSVVTTGQELIAARFLMGIGCAGSIMGAVTLVSRWCPGDRLSGILSWIWAFGQVGIFLAATPLALASDAFGWRSAFAGMALVTAAAGISFYLWVERIQPQAAAAATPESLRDIVRGLVAVWRTPGLVPVLAVHTFAYASMATVLGLWAGPFLADVYGLDVAARGNVLLAMGVAQLVGILVYGQLDRIFDTRKWVIVAGALGTIACLGALALIPGLTLAAAVTLLVLFCGVTAYALVIVAHGRSLFPDRLAGRGVTTVNIAQVAGLTVLAPATGAIVEALSGNGVAIAYRHAFGAIALALAGGLAIYLFARDAKPSEVRRSIDSTRMKEAS